MEASTFLAILLGAIIGGTLAKDVDYHWVLTVLVLGVAAIGWFASQSIPAAKPAMPEVRISFNIFSSTAAIIKKTKSNGAVFKTILAISWFWFYGAVIQTQFPKFASDVIGGNEDVAIALLAVFSIGIAIGSFVCSLLSHGKVEIGIMPFGAIGMSVFAWLLGDLSFPQTSGVITLSEIFQYSEIWWAAFYILMIAFFSGIYIVPLYAFLQIRSDPKHRSRTIAVNNVMNSLFMVCAGIMGLGLFKLGLDVSGIYKIVAIMNVVVTLYIICVVPEFFLRLVSWILVHSVYRISKTDLDNIPKEGPALLVCNHVSFFDPPVLLAVINRPARFIMWHGFYELPVAKWLFKGLNAIPIGNRSSRPELIDYAFDEVAAALENGELVVIFPEGGITRNGEMNRFQPGIDQIIKRTSVPVVPLAIRGMWGTWASRHKGRALKGLPTSYMKRLTVIAGPAVGAEDASRQVMEDKVRELRGDEK